MQKKKVGLFNSTFDPFVWWCWEKASFFSCHIILCLIYWHCFTAIRTGRLPLRWKEQSFCLETVQVSQNAQLQPGPYEFENRQRRKIPLYSCCPFQTPCKSVMGCCARAVDFQDEREWRSSISPQRGREMMAPVMERGSHRVQVNAWTLKAPGRSQTVRLVGTV